MLGGGVIRLVKNLTNNQTKIATRIDDSTLDQKASANSSLEIKHQILLKNLILKLYHFLDCLSNLGIIS